MLLWLKGRISYVGKIFALTPKNCIVIIRFNPLKYKKFVSFDQFRHFSLLWRCHKVKFNLQCTDEAQNKGETRVCTLLTPCKTFLKIYRGRERDKVLIVRALIISRILPCWNRARNSHRQKMLILYWVNYTNWNLAYTTYIELINQIMFWFLTRQIVFVT